MKCLGSSVAFLLRTRGNVEERLQAQDEKLAGKADLASMKAKFKRRKKKFHNKVASNLYLNSFNYKYRFKTEMILLLNSNKS